MLPVAEVLTRTDDLLTDPTRVRWTEAERIRWMNEAMGAILTRRPQAFSKRITLPLDEGTYQQIPEFGSMLLDVVRNANGRSIRRTDRQLLDDTNPDWHTAKPQSVVKNYTFDDRLPGVFYVYPPARAGTMVEIDCAVLPEFVSSAGDSLEIGLEYLEAVVSYVVYRCHSKDSEYAAPNTAISFYQAFEAALGIKSQSQAMASPNQPGTSV